MFDTRTFIGNGAQGNLGLSHVMSVAQAGLTLPDVLFLSISILDLLSNTPRVRVSDLHEQ